jgi:hypothetical protein
MIDLNDVHNIEGEADSPEEYYMSIQRAINSGSAWSFQGSYGRAMMDAIRAGKCMLGPMSADDYYGNYIPSRAQVKAGTEGSMEFVVKHSGAEWAAMMVKVQS